MSSDIQERWRALGRLPAGVLNKTELEYQDMLEMRRHLRANDEQRILWYMPHPMSLTLAAKLHYKPDFGVLLANREFEFHEVKTIIADDALAKIKMAATLFPFTFRMFIKDRRGWTEREVY